MKKQGVSEPPLPSRLRCRRAGGQRLTAATVRTAAHAALCTPSLLRPAPPLWSPAARQAGQGIRDLLLLVRVKGELRDGNRGGRQGVRGGSEVGRISYLQVGSSLAGCGSQAKGRTSASIQCQQAAAAC